MKAAAASGGVPRPSGGARCRCGHFPTHHMVVVSVAASANFRLSATGPCALCGESNCRRYAPGMA